MSSIGSFDPSTSEIRSPLIAALTEACNKISSILDMQTGTFENLQLSEIYVSEDDRYRLYQAPLGNKLWLQTPAPIVKKNGEIITPELDGFSIDFFGGSIAFEDAYRLNEADIVTVTARYILGDSQKINAIMQSLESLATKAGHYKGYFATYDDLLTSYDIAEDGDYALVGDKKSFYIWDTNTTQWISTQALVSLDNFYTIEQVDKLLTDKQDNIAPQGEDNSADGYYYGGRNTWQNVFEKVLGTVLKDFTADTNEKVTALDTVLSAFGKLQAQINHTIATEKGIGAPSEETEGVLGQDYVDTSNGDKYHLIAVETDEDGTKRYIWEKYFDKSDSPTNAITINGGANVEFGNGFEDFADNGSFTFIIEDNEGDDTGGGNGGENNGNTNINIELDETPTKDSQNAVSSGGVYAALTDVVRAIPTFQVFLLADNWSDNSQVVSDERFASPDKFNYFSMPAGESYNDYVNADIHCAEVDNGTMTFVAVEAPTEDIIVNVLRLQIGE